MFRGGEYEFIRQPFRHLGGGYPLWGKGGKLARQNGARGVFVRYVFRAKRHLVTAIAYLYGRVADLPAKRSACGYHFTHLDNNPFFHPAWGKLNHTVFAPQKKPFFLRKTTNAGGMYEVNYLFSLLIPSIFLITFLVASVKKVRVYDSFTEGMKGAIPLIVSIFPYIAAVTMLSMFLEVSGFGERLNGWLAPLYRFIGIPQELAPLLLIKPLSGSGSIAVLGELLEKYGMDSYIGRCACVLYGSSETVFYIGAVYFAGIKRKKLTAALCISLVSFVISVIFGCFLCKFL